MIKTPLKIGQQKRGWFLDPLTKLYLPLSRPDMQGATFFSKDLYAHTITPTGATWGSQGYAFDGNDWINCGASALFDTGANNFTFWVWAKITTIDNFFRRLISRENTVNTSHIVLRVTDTTNFSNHWEWAVSDGTNEATTRVVSSTPVINTWYFLRGERNGTTVRLYVNEVLNGTATNVSLGTLTNAGYNLNIGCYNNGADELSKSVIDEVGFVNGKILTAAEGAQIYNATKWRYQ